MLSIPQEKTLLIRLNRPKALNAMTAEASLNASRSPIPAARAGCCQTAPLTTCADRSQVEADMCKVLDWFESTPSLWVVILTGTGR